MFKRLLNLWKLSKFDFKVNENTIEFEEPRKLARVVDLEDPLSIDLGNDEIHTIQRQD